MMGIDVYKQVEGNYLKVDYIKSDDEIDNETVSKIRDRYSASDESKLLRLNNRTSPEFVDYNDYAEQCRAEGAQKKAAAAAARAKLHEITIPAGGLNEERKVYCESLL